MDLKTLTDQLIRLYLGDDPSGVAKVAEWLDEDLSVIGTGRQELYNSLREYRVALQQEIGERDMIHFEIAKLTYLEQPITENVVLVHGNLDIHGRGGSQKDNLVDIQMETRYSILYRCQAGQWRIVHLHHSVPNVDQMENEAYPKTLIQQVERVRKLAERDGLTDLLNYRFFQERYREMADRSGWLFIMDVDDFKTTNDVYGHLAGNQALKELAAILSSESGEEDLACRMGGDEFLLLRTGLPSQEEAAALAERLLQKVATSRNRDHLLHGLSIGMTPVAEKTPLDAALKKADQALYRSKTEGKNRYSVLL